jgi:branched-chain amino acid transport system ATP-binding protein
MDVLQIENLRSGYGEIEVLWSISMNVSSKGITALLGSNGSGKSTLMYCITGLQKIWSGALRLEGSDITKVKANKRVDLGISLVPEGRRIFHDMTVLENLLMGAYTKKGREKLTDSLELTYQLFPVLKERLSQRAGTLSGGEQQMLAISRALMARPKLLMLDEPSTGLSPRLSVLVMDTLGDLSEELPILLVEQNIKRSLEISETAYLLENGKIVLQGKSKEISLDENIKKAYMGI